MRVLYLTAADFRKPHAPTMRGRALARALARRGHRVTVVAPGDEASMRDPEFRGRPFFVSRRRGLSAITVHFGLARGLLAQAERARPDVILARETAWGIVAPALAAFLRVPYALEVNNRALDEVRARGIHGPRLSLMRAAYRFAYRRSARVIALTEPLRRSLVAEHGVPGHRACMIPNAVDTSLRRPMNRAECRLATGIPPDSRALFYVGSFHPQQGAGMLAPMMARIREKRPGAMIIVAGGGAGRADLENDVRRAGLGECFRFTGRVGDEELCRLIGAADLCVNPALASLAHMTDATFPQKLLEYLACARPVISVGASRQMRDVVQHAGTGILVRPGPNADADLALAALSLLANPEEAESMGERGHKLVRLWYTYELAAKRVEAALQDAVAGR